MSEGTLEKANPLTRGRSPRWDLGNLTSLALPAVLTAYFLAQVATVSTGAVMRVAWAWVPALGVALSFRLDGLSLIFALLICGTGTVVVLYSQGYLAGDERLGRFQAYLLGFLLSMLGLVLSDNLITLFVFWEMTTVTSFLLIGFEHEKEGARRAALQALLVTGAGGLALLAGFVLLGSVAGTFEISQLTAAGPLRAHPLYAPILGLVLLGAFTKSAQFPFHFWLPNAMAAPTPVSAFLHSATMVKAGIYLLARLHPVLSGTPAWTWTLTVVGASTAVLASVTALRQTDLKLMLAHTTVMALGTLTMFLGGDAPVTIAAAVTFLIVHALYKCALFLVVGNIDKRCGTRDIGRLGGLLRPMPLTAVAAAGAALSMAGFPPFLGFIGKELKYEGALAIASEPALAAAAAVAANALMVAAAGIVAWRPFLGPGRAPGGAPREVPARMWSGPVALAALGLLCGMTPWIVAEYLVQPGVRAVLGGPVHVKLALWHGLNVPLALSVLTLALGVTTYRYAGPLRRGLAARETCLPLTGDRAYEAALGGLKRLALTLTNLLQNGSQHRYLFTVFATLAVGVGGTLIATGAFVLPKGPPALKPYEWGVVGMIVVGAVLTLVTRSRLGAICALGVVGTGVALLFLLFGAPDVAMTQLLVETLVVIIVSVVLLRIPDARELRTGCRARAVLNGALALATGTAVGAVVLAATAGDLDRTVTAFFERNSVLSGHGRNIVNVILVDFRALDTLGEITVVAVAGLAALALIKLRPRPPGLEPTRCKPGGEP